MTITAGATDQTIYVEAVEDVGGTSPGEPKTGLINTNITGSYVRTREARVAITMATLAAASATHVDGGFIEVDAANTPGLYRTDLPDAAVATGLPEVIAFYEVATGSNALIRPLRIQISELDLQDGAAAGLTNLDAAISSVATDVWVQALTVSTATTTFGGVLDIAVSSRATSNVADFNNVAATDFSFHRHHYVRRNPGRNNFFTLDSCKYRPERYKRKRRLERTSGRKCNSNHVIRRIDPASTGCGGEHKSDVERGGLQQSLCYRGLGAINKRKHGHNDVWGNS